MKLVLLILLITFSIGMFGFAPSNKAKIHSHNDYEQAAPFWHAYSSGATSIEVDIFLKNNQLYVAHNRAQMKKERTLEKLYIEPLAELLANYHSISHLQLLVDIKTEAGPTLDRFVEIASKYPTIFTDKPHGIKTVISGNRPKPVDYSKYPAFIKFDGRSPEDADNPNGDKVALISRNFKHFSSWKGKGNIPEADSLELLSFITDCHNRQKPVRFWATPDTEQAYKTLIFLGVDYINTDNPGKLVAFLKSTDTGLSLPDWEESFFDIHHISTGRGNATFMVFPDGTSMLIDMGDMSETHPRTLSYRHTPALPNSSQTPAQWVSNYIRQFHPLKQNATLDYALITHYHDDHFAEIDPFKKRHPDGDYLLTGITELGSLVPIATLSDRGYDFPVDLKSPVVWEKSKLMDDPYSMIGTMHEYWKFIDFHEKRGTLKYEPFQLGTVEQFTMKGDNSGQFDFEVANLFANGRAVSTEGDTIQLYAEGTYPGENNLSTGLRFRYGTFSYYTGGDISGIDRHGQQSEISTEKTFAPIIGEVTVATLNHHGNRDSQSPFYVGQLKPCIWILQGWSSDHPGDDVLRRITSTQLYQGPRDVFATSLLEANKLVIGNRIDQAFKSTSGHVLVRVYPGGKKYTIFVLNDKTEERNIISSFDYIND